MTDENQNPIPPKDDSVIPGGSQGSPADSGESTAEAGNPADGLDPTEAVTPEPVTLDVTSTLPQPPAPIYSVAQTEPIAPPAPPAPPAAPSPLDREAQTAPNSTYGYPPAAATLPLDAATAWSAPAAGSSDPAAAGAFSKKRSARVGLIAALAVGALVGGVSGAGVSWGIWSNQPGTSSTVSTSSTPQNITVNDKSNINVVTAVAAKASPSVVTISVTGKSSGGTGSGVILSADGYILTNTHVVTLDGEIADPAVKVTTSDGRMFDATIVGTDPIADLAVIKLKDPSGLIPAEFADSSKLNVGEVAVAIGAPLGLSNTVTDGIVSALNRSISIASSAAPGAGSGTDSTTPNSGSPFDFWQFPNGGGGQNQRQTPSASATISLPVIQTDAAINPGNSGGALLNSDGKVIGINVAIASAGQTTTASQAGSIGVGFAIPANLAQRVAQEIIKSGSATHGLLGASVQDVSTTGSSAVLGATIKQVTSGGAAAAAGIQPEDVITSFNGVPITSGTDLTAQVRFLAGGSSSTITYVRGGKTVTADVTLGTLK